MTRGIEVQLPNGTTEVISCRHPRNAQGRIRVLERKFLGHITVKKVKVSGHRRPRKQSQCNRVYAGIRS